MEQILKNYIRKIISEQYNRSDEEKFWDAAEKTPKYKKFAEIVKANPDAEYFTYTSKKDGQKKKIVLMWSFSHLSIKDPKYKSKTTTYVTRVPIETFNDMKDDLQPSATKKKKGLGHDSYGSSSDSVYNIEDKEERARKLEELRKKHKDLYDMVKKYGSGYYTYLNTKDNRKYKIRLFVSSTDNLCVFQKNKSRYGYPFGPTSELIMHGNDFQPVKEKLTSAEEKLYKQIVQLKNLWTTKVHPNLWQKEVAIWKTVNLNEVKAQCELLDGNHHEFWRWFHDKYKTGGELVYKTTTVGSWKPKWSSQFEQYKQNIKKHLAGKEKFSYSWQSSYDVRVSGNKGSDGEYRAWFSLEYRGTGNGHYYLLVNENLAVFAEDD